MTGAPDVGASFVTLSGTGFVGDARFSFDERAAAAAAAGFTAIGVRLSDILGSEGGIENVIGVPRLYDLGVTEVEFVDGWAMADDASAALANVGNISRLADAWGPFHVTSGEFASGHLNVDRAAANLADFAEALEPSGARIAVEAFAWSALSDYQIAVEIVRRSGAQNAGIMLDVWHFFNTGGSLDWLATLSPEDLTAVQLNDGNRVTSDFREHARNERWLPGHGSLDVAGLLSTVVNLGFGGSYLVESSYPDLRDQDVSSAAQQAFASAQVLWENAFR